jgi:hypothetical protein
MPGRPKKHLQPKTAVDLRTTPEPGGLSPLIMLFLFGLAIAVLIIVVFQTIYRSIALPVYI